MVSFEQIPTTSRSAEELSKVYGFPNVESLANSLPGDANALDIGAGDSDLGKRVATLRPDVKWTNLDYSYHSGMPAEITEDSPPNLHFVAGDVTKLDELFESESFQAIFSYWLFPHLSLADMDPAFTGARQIFRISDAEGVIRIGPDIGKKYLPYIKLPPAVEFNKKNVSEEEFIASVVSKTKAVGYARYFQLVVDNIAVPYFGTTRVTKDTNNFLPDIFNPRSGNYVYSASREGLGVLGNLAIYIIKHPKR